MKIIDGKKIRDEILAKVKMEVAGLPFQPIFCDILVGDNPTSEQYVRMKARYAESVGIKFHSERFVESSTTKDLIEEIRKINNMKDMCGLIVQLPLPENFNEQEVLNAVSPNIDVDCLNTKTNELFYRGEGEIKFPTALACMHILDSLNIEMMGKNIVVIGQGILVGRPVTYLLEEKGLKVDVVISITEENIKRELIKNADIIISAAGQEKIIKGDMIKPGVVIIDAGTSESGGGIVGDVDIESIIDIECTVSPVPGGVGPVTVAMLLNNVLQVAKSRASVDGARHDFAKSI